MKSGRRGLLICAVLTLLWMAVIFWFSANNSEDSAGMSSKLLQKLLSVFVPDWNKMSLAEHVQMIKRLHHGFRKLGHFTEYAILGGLLSLTLHGVFCQGITRIRPHLRAVLLSAAAALLYAASDEFHQQFVDGRDGNFKDVLIDFSGACTGILICLLIYAAVRGIRKWKARHVT